MLRRTLATAVLALGLASAAPAAAEEPAALAGDRRFLTVGFGFGRYAESAFRASPYAERELVGAEVAGLVAVGARPRTDLRLGLALEAGLGASRRAVKETVAVPGAAAEAGGSRVSAVLGPYLGFRPRGLWGIEVDATLGLATVRGAGSPADGLGAALGVGYARAFTAGCSAGWSLR